MPRRPKQEQPDFHFSGFERPESNYFKMPNDWIDLTAEISNVAELKVVQYILRHTWGYQEYDIKKHITIDEFSRGRRRSDGSRMDKGTGLSERAVRYGLQSAIAHGLVEELVDDSDRGRTKKFYSLKMSPDALASSERQDLQSGVQTLHPGVQTLPPRGAQIAPRSEKDTKERQIRDSKVRKTSTQEEGKERNSPRPAPMPSNDHQDKPVTHQGFEAVGTTLSRRSTHVSEYDDDRQQILSYLEDFSREFNDRAPLKSTVTRAYRLYKQSGRPIATFVDAMYQARAITKERSASIRSQAEGSSGRSPKNKTAYFFSVLEDVLGLKPKQDHDTYPSGSANSDISSG